MTTHRRAFVLIAVLWVMVGVSDLGLGVALIARRALAEARNRMAAREATWQAEDCVSRARATIALALGGDLESTGVSTAWQDLDRVVRSSSLLRSTTCMVQLRAAGQTLDINTIDSATLSRLFSALGIAPISGDSLVDAIFDWRDTDDRARPHGTERSWYLAERRNSPRNGPFADAHEVDLVRGAFSIPDLDTLLGVDRGRVALNQAPLPVVAALPGFTPEAVALVAEHRLRHVPIRDLLTFAAELSPAARDTLQANYGDLVQLCTVSPDAWTLTSRGSAGTPPVTVVVELRLIRA